MRRMSNEYRKEKKSKYKICTQNADVDADRRNIGICHELVWRSDG